jgi:hypothetical protein
MKKKNSIASGIILILIGSFFLALEFLPESVTALLNLEQQWPLILVAIGGLFILGAVAGSPGLAVPGSIVGGLGGLMYVQNITDNWGSWSYAWALILVFIGIGTFLANLLEGRPGRGLREGGRVAFIGIVFFLFMGLLTGGWSIASADLLWPAALILGGLWLLSRNVWQRS